MPFFIVGGITPLPTFTGLGDVVPSGLLGYWGNRAAKASLIGNNCAKLIRTDTTQADIVSAASGFIDTGAAFFNGSAYKIVTLYDQIGVNHMGPVAGNVTSRPQFILNDFNGKPVIKCDRTVPQIMATVGGGAAYAQPFTVSMTIMVQSANSGFNPGLIGDVLHGTDNAGGFVSTVPEVKISASGAPNSAGVSITYDQMVSIQLLYNGGGSASKININSTTTNVSVAGSAALASLFNFPHDGNSDAMECKILELAIWSGDKSSSFAALYANKQAGWGIT